MSARQPQGMLKLLWMEDPVKGVFSLEFIGPCHIDADTRLISTEGSPDFSSALAEGDGWTLVFSQQEMRPAEQAACHLNREGSSAGGLTVFPERTFHSHKVIPQGGDEAVLLPCPVRPTLFEGFGGAWHGCAEDGSPSMNETHGMNGYSLAILRHIRSHLFRSPFFPSPEGSVRNPVHPHTMNLHDGAALIVNPSGVPGEAFVVLRLHAGLQRYLFPYPALSQKPHLPDLHGNHRSPLRWVRCSDVEAYQLQKGLEKVRGVLVPRVP